MFQITKNFFTSILNIIEPEKISKINVRNSKYLINIHPKHYLEDNEINISASNKVQNKQQQTNTSNFEQTSQTKTQKTDTIDNNSKHNEANTKENNLDSTKNTSQKDKTKEGLDVEKNQQQNTKSQDSKTQQSPNQKNQSQADKIKFQQQNDSKKPKDIKEAQEIARQLRFNEIKSIFMQVFDFYNNENQNDIEVSDLNPIFDNLILQFIKQDIIAVVDDFIYSNKTDIIKIIIKCSAKHNNLSSILLDCIFVANKKVIENNG